MTSNLQSNDIYGATQILTIRRNPIALPTSSLIWDQKYLVLKSIRELKKTPQSVDINDSARNIQNFRQTIWNQTISEHYSLNSETIGVHQDSNSIRKVNKNLPRIQKLHTTKLNPTISIQFLNSFGNNKRLAKFKHHQKSKQIPTQAIDVDDGTQVVELPTIKKWSFNKIKAYNKKSFNFKL